MYKIDDISYPEGSVDMLNDPHIGPMYRAYLDTKMCEWVYIYIDEAMKKRDPKTQFKKFFAAKAKHPVNIDGDTLAMARKMGGANDWKNKDWKKVYDFADSGVKRVADGEHDEKFYQKDASFKAHHVFMLEKQMYRKNYPGLMAEFGVTDKKALANVAAMLKADKKSDGPRSAKAYVKKNKVQMKANEAIKKIKKAFKIK